MRVNNDPTEENFATLTNVLSNGGQINFASAAGIGQVSCNHDYYHGHKKLVGRKKESVEPIEQGTFTNC